MKLFFLYILHFYKDNLETKTFETVNSFVSSIKNIPEIFDEFENLKNNDKHSQDFIQFITKDFYDTLIQNINTNTLNEFTLNFTSLIVFFRFKPILTGCFLIKNIFAISRQSRRSQLISADQ